MQTVGAGLSLWISNHKLHSLAQVALRSERAKKASRSNLCNIAQER